MCIGYIIVWINVGNPIIMSNQLKVHNNKDPPAAQPFLMDRQKAKDTKQAEYFYHPFSPLEVEGIIEKEI